MFHSLSIYRRALFSEKPIRNADNVRKFADLIEESHGKKHLVRHRFHARFELDNLDRADELMDYIRAKKVHLVSFMDHTPGQGQYRDLEMYRKTLKGYQTLSEEELDGIIKDSQGAKKLTLEAVRELSAAALENGIAIASHDDDTVEKISLIKGFGATISEFPITMEVAREAKEKGLHTIAGAPNILLGGSHSGNLSAAEAVSDGCIDILCSDYYPAAMLHAVFILHEKYGLGLAEAFSLVTINPARAVRMDGLTGSIEPGKRADILIIEKIENGFPAVTSAIVDGKRVFSTNYR
jgi:alpha-D-ribose 1-methylphosphonate 5-triphosphate diphosphatase